MCAWMHGCMDGLVLYEDMQYVLLPDSTQVYTHIHQLMVATTVCCIGNQFYSPSIWIYSDIDCISFYML